MPTRKQKRRRQKDRRHEWEYVYVDDEGQEVEVDEAEVARPKASKQPVKATAAKPGARSRRPTGNKAGRTIDPPSWRRVIRRGAIFAPVMLIVVYLLRPKDATAASVLLQVLVLLLVFVPFSYYVDALMYRNYRKRIGDPLPARTRKKG